MDTSGEHLFTTFVVAFSGKERNLTSFLTPKRSRRVDTEVMYKVDQRSECACVCVCVCEERERERERENVYVCARVYVYSSGTTSGLLQTHLPSGPRKDGTPSTRD